MNNELISKQAAVNALKELKPLMRTLDYEQYIRLEHSHLTEDDWECVIKTYKELVKALPYIDPRTGEVTKIGEWVYYYGELDIPHCSECGITPIYKSNFCPHCGAKMKIISTNTKKETGDTYSRGSNIPKPNKRPPMPPVKYPKEDKRHEQKDACVNCRYYSVDPLSDPCDECIGKAGFGYNRRSAAIEPRKEDENG